MRRRARMASALVVASALVSLVVPLLFGAPSASASGHALAGASCSSERCVRSAGEAQAQWAATTAPLPANAGGSYAFPELPEIACVSSTCTAVGSYDLASGFSQGLLVRGSGSSWAATEADLPANAYDGGATGGGLSAVACGSACAAIGDYAATSGSGLLLETGSGTSWAPYEAPIPDGATNPQLTGVACGAVCAAIGKDVSAGEPAGLLELGSDGSWTASQAPLPADAGSPSGIVLQGAACVSSTCVVFGYYYDTNGTVQGLLDTETSGGAWTAAEAPLPTGALSGTLLLSAAACGSASACTVVGTYSAGVENTQSVLLTGIGQEWTASKAPLPAGVSSGSLQYVACPSATSCAAVGSYVTYQGETGLAHMLITTKSGAKWSSIAAPVPANIVSGGGVSVGPVACTSAGSCAVVGEYNDQSGDDQALVVTGAGTAWTATEVSVPAGAPSNPGPVLNSVACVQSCAAVGTYSEGTVPYVAAGSATGGGSPPVSADWGFDTASPATTKFLTSKSVAGLGAPTFVGQYLEYSKKVHDVITGAIAAAIRKRHARIVLFSSPKTPGRNLTTAKEADSDADLAVAAARKLRVPQGVAIFRDVENNYHITAAYVAAWVDAVRAKGYVPGFYENPKERGSRAFSTAYCTAARDHPTIPSRTVLFADEPEVSATSSKAESAAPAWGPASPYLSGCKSKTVGWQYLENPKKKAPDIDDDEALPSDLKYFW